MICKKCMTVMELGTSYEQRKGGTGNYLLKDSVNVKNAVRKFM